MRCPFATGPSWDKLPLLFPRKGSAGRSRRAARKPRPQPRSSSPAPCPRRDRLHPAQPPPPAPARLCSGAAPPRVFSRLTPRRRSPLTFHLAAATATAALLRCHHNPRPPLPQPGTEPGASKPLPGTAGRYPRAQQERAGKASAHAQRCPAPPRPSTPRGCVRASLRMRCPLHNTAHAHRCHRRLTQGGGWAGAPPSPGTPRRGDGRGGLRGDGPGGLQARLYRDETHRPTAAAASTPQPQSPLRPPPLPQLLLPWRHL